MRRTVLGALASSQKAPITFMSVCLSVSSCISGTPTVQISVKSDIGDFHEKSVHRLPNLIKIRTKISCTSHEYLSTFYCCRRHKFDHKSVVMQQSLFYILLTVTCSSTIHTERLVAFLLSERLTRTRYNVRLCVYCVYCTSQCVCDDNLR